MGCAVRRPGLAIVPRVKSAIVLVPVPARAVALVLAAVALEWARVLALRSPDGQALTLIAGASRSACSASDAGRRTWGSRPRAWPSGWSAGWRSPASSSSRPPCAGVAGRSAARAVAGRDRGLDRRGGGVPRVVFASWRSRTGRPSRWRAARRHGPWPTRSRTRPRSSPPWPPPGCCWVPGGGRFATSWVRSSATSWRTWPCEAALPAPPRRPGARGRRLRRRGVGGGPGLLRRHRAAPARTGGSRRRPSSAARTSSRSAGTAACGWRATAGSTRAACSRRTPRRRSPSSRARSPRGRPFPVSIDIKPQTTFPLPAPSTWRPTPTASRPRRPWPAARTRW